MNEPRPHHPIFLRLFAEVKSEGHLNESAADKNLHERLTSRTQGELETWMRSAAAIVFARVAVVENWERYLQRWAESTVWEEWTGDGGVMPSYPCDVRKHLDMEIDGFPDFVQWSISREFEDISDHITWDLLADEQDDPSPDLHALQRRIRELPVSSFAWLHPPFEDDISDLDLSIPDHEVRILFDFDPETETFQEAESRITQRFQNLLDLFRLECTWEASSKARFIEAEASAAVEHLRWLALRQTQWLGNTEIGRMVHKSEQAIRKGLAKAAELLGASYHDLLELQPGRPPGIKEKNPRNRPGDW